MRIYLHPRFKGYTVAQIREHLNTLEPVKELLTWDIDLAKEVYNTLDLSLRDTLPRTLFKDFVEELYKKNKKAWFSFYYLSRNKRIFGKVQSLQIALEDKRCEKCKAIWVCEIENGFCDACSKIPEVQQEKKRRILEKSKVEDTSVYGTRRKYPKPKEITWKCKGFTLQDLKVLKEARKKFIPSGKGNHIQVVRLLDFLHDEHLQTWKNFTYMCSAMRHRTVRIQIDAAIANNVCKFCNTFIVQPNLTEAPCDACIEDPELNAKKNKEKTRLAFQSFKERTGLDHPMVCPDSRKQVGLSFKARSEEDQQATKDTRRATSLEKYGVSHPNQRKEFSERMREVWGQRSDSDVAEIVGKRVSTNLERYGVGHSSQHPDYKEKAIQGHLRNSGFTHNMRNPEHLKEREKASLEKWGTTHPMKNKKVKKRALKAQEKLYGGVGLASPITKAKARATNLERYGYEVATSNPEIMAKCKASWVKIYGFDNPNKNPEQAAKALKSAFGRRCIKIKGTSFTVQGNNEALFLKRLVKDFGVRNVHTQFCTAYEKAGIRKKYGWSPDFYVSHKGREFVLELKSTYTLYGSEKVYLKNVHKAKNSDVRFVFSHRKKFYVLPKDWYNHPNINYLCYSLAHKHVAPRRLRSMRVSIKALLQRHGLEYKIQGNNITAQGKTLRIRDVHELCKGGEKHPHITTADWKNRRQATRLYVERFFNINKHTVYARRCEIKTYEKEAVKEFFDKCHIQGPARNGITLALVHEGNIVAAMTFSNVVSVRGSKKQEGAYELIRYATSCNVPGGASKLLKAFERQYQPTSILSYADNRMFNGGMYSSHLGFKEVGKVRPGYTTVWDFFTLDVRSKQSTSRGSLSKYGWFDPSLTERENCERMYLLRLPDLGKTKYLKIY